MECFSPFFGVLLLSDPISSKKLIYVVSSTYWALFGETPLKSPTSLTGSQNDLFTLNYQSYINASTCMSLYTTHKKNTNNLKASKNILTC